MIDFFKIAIVKVDGINWNTVDGKYDDKYHGKIVMDGAAAFYCPDHGKVLYGVACGFDDTSNGGGKLDIEELWHTLVSRQYENSAHSEGSKEPEHKLSIAELTHLKASGYTLDEIIRLKQEGIL